MKFLVDVSFKYVIVLFKIIGLLHFMFFSFKYYQNCIYLRASTMILLALMALLGAVWSSSPIHEISTDDILRINSGVIFSKLPQKVLLQRQTYRVLVVIPFPDVSILKAGYLNPLLYDRNCSEVELEFHGNFTGDNLFHFGNENQDQICSRFQKLSNGLVNDVKQYGDNLKRVINMIKDVTGHYNSSKFYDIPEKRGIAIVGEALELRACRHRHPS